MYQLIVETIDLNECPEISQPEPECHALAMADAGEGMTYLEAYAITAMVGGRDDFIAYEDTETGVVTVHRQETGGESFVALCHGLREVNQLALRVGIEDLAAAVENQRTTG